MKTCRCQPNSNAPRERRRGEIAGWLISAATLVMMPKCPACLAAYVAFATGIGISFPTATWLRAVLIFSCIASMGYLAIRRLKQRVAINASGSGSV